MTVDDFSTQNQSDAWHTASSPPIAPVICPACSAVLPPDSLFCDACGAELSPPASCDASGAGIAPSAFPRRKTLAARYFLIAAALAAATFLFWVIADDWRERREDFIIASHEAAKLGLTYERVAKNPSAYENAAVSWRLLVYGNAVYYEGDWKKPVVVKDAASSRDNINSGERCLLKVVARVKGRDDKGAIIIDEIK
ncbi:MAG: hypothetical protein CVU77_07380 [Elusimicrobia bacterium HGW-Elusimicrobia-1]|jgi:hypothetical protein|nr:MAG: hypothetical protein CVU77_07380 [Elusimicrobia bacterium HGW-Elusimicrobia-1]